MSNYKTNITIFDDVKAQKAKEVEVTWEQLKNRIINPKVYKERMEMPLLKMATFGEERTEHGNSLRHDDNVIEVTGIEGDYDGGVVSMEEASAKAQKMGMQLAFYSTGRSTPQNPRWRVLAPLSKPIQPEERYYWVGMLNYVLGGILAPESFTLSQSFFFGKIDGSSYQTLVLEGATLDTFDNQFDPIYPRTPEVQMPTGHKTESNFSIEEARKVLGFISPDVGYVEWMNIAFGLKDEFGDEGFDLWDDWSSQGAAYKKSEMGYKWASIDRDSKRTDGSRVKIGTMIHMAKANGYVPTTLVKTSAQDDFDVVQEFTVDKKGRIEATQTNLLKLLDTYQFRYDEFRAAYMGVFDGVVRVITEEDYTRIQLRAEQMGFMRISTAMVRENVLMKCADNTFDSAIEWGNSLQWDGKSRCENLLHTYFGAKDTPYTSAVSLYITSAMGGRLMNPGCKADAAVVLVGNQGVGKTMGISALSPMDDTFVEINLSTRDADQSRQLRGKLIGELGELRGLKSREAEDIKSWMSRTHEEWVPKYKEFSMTFKRRLTFWGSTNEQTFLNDVTGNRRWLPVDVTNPNPDLIAKDREQIWAEAIYLFKTFGVMWQVAQDLASEEREAFFEEDPLVEEVRQYLVYNKDEPYWTGKQIWDYVRPSKPFDRGEGRRLASIMKRLGISQQVVKVHGKATRVYKNPDLM